MVVREGAAGMEPAAFHARADSGVAARVAPSAIGAAALGRRGHTGVSGRSSRHPASRPVGAVVADVPAACGTDATAEG